MHMTKLSLELQNVRSSEVGFMCIHQLFEERVEQTPEDVALVFGDIQLTYRQLNIRANKLANYLKEIGVGAEVLVGIYTERSIEMVVGLLGILKAGGAYVPIDPNYPPQRQHFIIADTRLQILLAQDSLIDALAANAEAEPTVQLEQRVNLESCKVVSLSPQNSNFSSASEENLVSKTHADNLAYVMYTSGSTGQPKGVCVVHRGVVRLVKDTNYASFSPAEVFLQLAPIAFDAATFEIWGCLLNGGKLVIASPHALSLEELGQVIQQHRITTLWLTAGLFQLMVDRNIDALKSLHQLLAGGDILSVPHVQKFLDSVENCQLINGYGPTENTTFTCCYSITAPLQLDASIPIGYPIANTQVYLLDEHLDPVADGEVGEIYIGGDGLARGYLDRPELTAQKFVNLSPSPSPTRRGEQEAEGDKKKGWKGELEIGERLYKTGDLARYLPDGKIEFLGRIDNQVKVRGFRIELGEIERVLAQHPQVRENIVLARQIATQEKQLVAYIVAHDRNSLPSEQLREFIQQRLPDYLMPSAFVFLEVLPLTPNGKIDRQALPAPSRERPQLEQAYIAPQNDLERILAKIWCDLLGLERVGINDNYFDLGGTSISILQVAIEIHQQLGTEIPVVKLFQHSTIAGLAEYLQPQPGRQQSLDKLQSRAQQQRVAQARRRK